MYVTHPYQMRHDSITFWRVYSGSSPSASNSSRQGTLATTTLESVSETRSTKPPSADTDFTMNWPSLSSSRTFCPTSGLGSIGSPFLLACIQTQPHCSESLISVFVHKGAIESAGTNGKNTRRHRKANLSRSEQPLLALN